MQKQGLLNPKKNTTMTTEYLKRRTKGKTRQIVTSQRTPHVSTIKYFKIVQAVRDEASSKQFVCGETDIFSPSTRHDKRRYERRSAINGMVISCHTAWAGLCIYLYKPLKKRLFLRKIFPLGPRLKR